MLDFRIETFLTVCDTMSYHESAALLHITQPAVTQHIHFLEQSYHCKLFLYENRHLKKTASARLLEEYARAVKANEATLRQKLQDSRVTELNIGATKTIGDYVIGDYVKHFISGQENTLTLVVDNTESLLHLLDNSRLDFALVEGYFDKMKYDYLLFRREPFVGICATDHSFAGREITLPELLSETLICREEGSGTRAILENKLQDFNTSISQFQRNICISSFRLILNLVSQGCGISFVYQVLADYGTLAQFKLKDCPIEREFNFVYLKNTNMEEKIRYFMGE